MKYKIVSDSSSDLAGYTSEGFASVPLKIISENREYVDDASLDVPFMVTELLEYRGKLSTSCPSPLEWEEAFGDAENIFCITISGALSGSYNAALIAKNNYELEHLDRHVYIIDSLSTGPGMKLIIEKLQELFDQDMNFQEICEQIESYKKQTELLFMLQSIKNLANNGRIPLAIAKVAGLLNIRMIGKASEEGRIELVDKCRGEKKAIRSIFQHILDLHFSGKKIRIGHCMNEFVANEIKHLTLERFPHADIEIYELGGLDSFYAEKGGVIIGFEI